MWKEAERKNKRQ